MALQSALHLTQTWSRRAEARLMVSSPAIESAVSLFSTLVFWAAAYMGSAYQSSGPLPCW
jgi:hypothetical protein